LLLRAGQAAVEAGAPDAETLLADASALLEAHGDVASAAEAEASRAQYEWYHGGDFLDRFERAVALVADTPDSHGKAFAYAGLGRTLAIGSHVEEAKAALEEALRIADRLDLPDIRLYALHYLGLARVRGGYMEGLADIQASIELARIHDPTFVPRAMNNLGAQYYWHGELRKTYEICNEILLLSTRLGMGAQIRWQHMMQVGTMSELGDWDYALAIIAGDPSLLEPGYRHRPAALAIRAFISF